MHGGCQWMTAAGEALGTLRIALGEGLAGAALLRTRGGGAAARRTPRTRGANEPDSETALVPNLGRPSLPPLLPSPPGSTWSPATRVSRHHVSADRSRQSKLPQPRLDPVEPSTDLCGSLTGVPPQRERQQKAMGAAFLAHQVDKLEKSVDSLSFDRSQALYNPNGPRGHGGAHSGQSSAQHRKLQLKPVYILDASVMVHALPLVKLWVRQDQHKLIVPLAGQPSVPTNRPCATQATQLRLTTDPGRFLL